MDSFLKFLSGYVMLEVRGKQCERFLNLCRSRDISITKLFCPEPGIIRFEISVRDFFTVRTIRRKTRVHIRVTGKHGLPFLLWHNRKRKAFFSGLVLCFCLIAVLSGRIWNIHIEGNIQNTTPEILDFLGEQGIVHGIAKGKINCSDLAAAVRRQYPEITWVSARIEGTRLILTIQEEEIPQDSTDEDKTPCNLTADTDGTIVKIITRQGIPQVMQGDTCQKGDLLVLGCLEILNDSQEVIRYEYVRADADIYVEHELSYYRVFPLSYEKEILQGKTEKNLYFRIGNWYFAEGGNLKPGWRRAACESRLKLTENFYLPVWLGKISSEKVQKVTAVYSKEEAKARAFRQLQQYEKKLIEKGLQISANNVKIDVDYDSCKARGTLTVIEKTGKETPVEIKEQPEERTAENG